MNFLIASTFQDSLLKLTADEQRLVKTTVFDLQVNPANPGLKFHKLGAVKDKRFCSVYANMDIRVIVHKDGSNFLVCYAGHHDPAYQWAKTRRLTTHPKTGAAQLVEVQERVEEIVIPQYVESEPIPIEKPLIFKDIPDEELLGYGVPEDLLATVRKVDEDTLLELADHLPEEAAEALLELATGGKPTIAPEVTPEADPFEHPDAKRRFRLMNNSEELKSALEFPWDKWTIFLHPDQRQLVERDFNGPARASGSAGTGKTIVALHRAVYLAKNNPDSRVLLTTFSEPLANALRNKVRRLVSSEPTLAERLEVHAMSSLGQHLYKRNCGSFKVASQTEIESFIQKASEEAAEHKFSDSFLYNEWSSVVDAWQLRTWEEYRDVRRLGRRTRLAETQRAILWGIFERVRAGLAESGLMTLSDIYEGVTQHITEASRVPFDFAVVDEAQDINVAELRMLAALGGARPNALFFSGDLGQRIFQQPFSWKALGVSIQGRSHTLKVNYRTSHQIRRMADRLLPAEIADVDGNAEGRKGTVSVFNGPEPEIQIADDTEAEIKAVSEWLKQCQEDGIRPDEIGVFVRSDDEIQRAEAAVSLSGMKSHLLSEKMQGASNAVFLSPMHLAKGLEFRAVISMACDDEVIPSQTRIETVTDDSDLEDVYNTERQLLYVALTRARDRLLVTAVDPASEFLEDMDAAL